MIKELEILREYCKNKGLKTTIIDTKNGGNCLVDEFGYCFIYALGNNFYKILATELIYDEENGVSQQTIESGKLFIDDTYSFIQGILQDNEYIKNKI